MCIERCSFLHIRRVQWTRRAIQCQLRDSRDEKQTHSHARKDSPHSEDISTLLAAHQLLELSKGKVGVAGRLESLRPEHEAAKQDVKLNGLVRPHPLLSNNDRVHHLVALNGDGDGNGNAIDGNGESTEADGVREKVHEVQHSMFGQKCDRTEERLDGGEDAVMECKSNGTGELIDEDRGSDELCKTGMPSLSVSVKKAQWEDHCEQPLPSNTLLPPDPPVPPDPPDGSAPSPHPSQISSMTSVEEMEATNGEGGEDVNGERREEDRPSEVGMRSEEPADEEPMDTETKPHPWEDLFGRYCVKQGLLGFSEAWEGLECGLGKAWSHL